VSHQGAACDAASVHFGPTIRKTDIGLLVNYVRRVVELNSLEKDGDGVAATVGPDERAGFSSHLRRHNVLYFTRC